MTTARAREIWICLEPGDLRLGQVVIKRVAVVKLGRRQLQILTDSGRRRVSIDSCRRPSCGCGLRYAESRDLLLLHRISLFCTAIFAIFRAQLGLFLSSVQNIHLHIRRQIKRVRKGYQQNFLIRLIKKIPWSLGWSLVVASANSCGNSRPYHFSTDDCRYTRSLLKRTSVVNKIDWLIDLLRKHIDV